ncbi:hypothetical protein WA026_005117 [Henosepilachna vigintioctopunctata]|uniref:Uncharacterized protein n=1 Tax=Henosepilachna vigintioctopunctata TaxID=420089 RepID=A0AAW1UTP8_9CUCU
MRFILSTFSEEDRNFGIQEHPKLPDIFAPEDFLVVEVHGKKSYRLYVDKVLYPEDEGYVRKFFKSVSQTWGFQEPKEEAAYFRKMSQGSLSQMTTSKRMLVSRT